MTSSARDTPLVPKLIGPYLKEMVRAKASDLFLTAGSAPVLRIERTISTLPSPPLDAAGIQAIVDDLLDEEQADEFRSTLESNIALEMETGERFRVNLFHQKHQTGMVVRLIKRVIPTFEELRLPDAYRQFIMEKRGLVLVVGAAGSGKSTSLAAMLDYRNTHGSGHIITIEDPIEFVHEHKNCIFTQREIGIDTYSYSIALKNALRQSPDVVMIGEIRDRDTMENAILFCETGHLVVATVHASNASQAIERITNLFPEEMHRRVLTTLSQNLKAVASQRLVVGSVGNQILANEIMLNVGLVRILIEEGKIKELRDTIAKNYENGMQTFDQCLLELYEKGMISGDVALQEADNPGNLRLRISQGQSVVSDITKKVGEGVALRDSKLSFKQTSSSASEF